MRKFLLFMGMLLAIAVAAFGIIYAALTLVISKEFDQIEDTEASQGVSRAIDLLNERVNGLGSKSSDWASWDDAYRFVADKNQAFISTNLADASIKGLNLSYILFINSQGQLVHLESPEPAANTPALREKLMQHFAPGSKLLASPGSTTSGILRMPDRPLLFYARPIVKSDGTGPVRGTLVFAHYLDAADIEQISKLTRVNVSIYVRDSPTLPAKIAALVPQMSSTAAIDEHTSANELHAYQLVADSSGQPYLILGTTQTREMYQSAQRAIRYFLIIIGGIILIAVAIILVFFRIVLARDKTIRLKDEFFSIASHEIRTPLGAIKGNASLLSAVYGEKNGKAFSEITEDIKASSERLIRLVTNYLDAARLEQGKISVNAEAFTLNLVCQQVADELKGLAAEKGIAIKNNIQDATIRVKGDKDHVKQVLYNLIGNALKFTEAGSVTISAQLDGGMVKVLVEDTGRGVPAAAKDALFKKFQQTRKEDAAKGSGLGLYISKLLVEKMGGAIRLESSEEGKGTCVSFSIPASDLHH